MAMNFNKKVPDWENVGAEPDSELKKGGFKAGYKPPAAYFNWFFNRISESVKELQSKLTSSLKALAFKDKVGDRDITDVAADKVTQDSTHRMLTDTDRTNWNDANTKKHTHSNKTVLDKVTQALLDNWNAAFAHVSNKANPHGVTKSQVGLGNVPNVATNNQTPTYEQASELSNIVSGEKLSVSLGKIMKAIADFITHKADAVIHITAAERAKWNTVTNKVDKVSGKQLSTNDYTTAEKNKLSGIAAGAEVNVQADWNQTDTAADDYIKNRPASFPPSGHTHDDRYYTETEMNTKLGAKVDASGGDIANTKVSSFTASTASYPVPAGGDTLKVGFGKITKFFTDIKNWMTGVCLIGSIVNNCVTNNAKLPLSAAQGKVLMDLYTVLNTNSQKKAVFSFRYGKIENQTINTGSIMDSNEPLIPFDCYVIANHHITLKSAAKNAKVYWFLEGNYLQGNESWDGTVSPEHTFEKTFIYEAKAGQAVQLKMTDSNGVGIISRGNNNSLNRHSFIFIPK